ncbi:MAG: ASCH domain-containing protein [Clostridia bacterium]|nr:ASCH domain-containing protein [Clostridia bacterium]
MQMQLSEKPFLQIKNGEKTVEVRLLDDKRKTLKVGDRISFTNRETGDIINAKVVALHNFSSFEKLFCGERFKKCGFNNYTCEEAVKEMYNYYSPEEEKRLGVLGIEIKLI